MAHAQLAFVKCESYDRTTVEAAVKRALDLLGGMGGIIPSRGTCLIKPNLLSPSRPEQGTTTHPEVLRAVILEAKAVAERVVVGDSPGRGDTLRAAEASGVSRVCRECSVQVVSFEEETQARFSGGRVCKEFTFSRHVTEASSIVNVAKMKTHGFMTYTGAVKNLFGCIPGTKKAKMHLRFQEPWEFGLMLLDIAMAVKPALSVLDAVVAMDGDGPSHGRARPFGAIIASVDPAAVDAVALRTAGVDPMRVPYLRAAAELGVGAVASEDITVVGDRPESLAVKDFRLPGSGPSRSFLRVAGAARKSVTAKPVVDFSKCTGCAHCQKSCPPQAITMSPQGKAVIGGDRCIRCYCCHEMCPSGAISLKMGVVAKVVDRFLESMNRR